MESTKNWIITEDALHDVISNVFDSEWNVQINYNPESKEIWTDVIYGNDWMQYRDSDIRRINKGTILDYISQACALDDDDNILMSEQDLIDLVEMDLSHEM